MYVSVSKTIKNGKQHITHMLRHSYRDNGKVKQKNIACLNTCSLEEIAAIKIALKDPKFVLNQKLSNSIESSVIKQSKSFGGAFAIHEIAKTLKIDKAIGDCADGKIALMQVLARVIGQGSKLKTVRLQDTYAIGELLGLKEKIFDDKIYRNLDWVEKNQEAIEKRLWKFNGDKAETHLFLYDVTSTYLEGQSNEYGAFGYNRDGKRGKKQIVIGLLANQDGMPIKITVFDGNTNDTKTFAQQVSASAKQFGVKNVVFVGDRGMIKSPQINDLPEGCKYITAISKKEIETLIANGVMQLSLFDITLTEVILQETGVRYIMRRNPIRQEEIGLARQKKIERLEAILSTGNEKIANSKRAKISTLHNKIAGKIKQYKLDKIIKLQEIKNDSDRVVAITVDQEALSKARELDGCYVIKSDVDTEITKNCIHDRYKDLKFVEDSFRTMKQSHLEIRPVYVRKRSRTAADVFIVMLSYMIVRHMKSLLSSNNNAEAKTEILAKEVLDSLNMICLHEIGNGDSMIHKIPSPSSINKAYLEKLCVKLPEMFVGRINVSTKI